MQCILELIARPWVSERLNCLAIGRTISKQTAGVIMVYGSIYLLVGDEGQKCPYFQHTNNSNKVLLASFSDRSGGTIM